MIIREWGLEEPPPRREEPQPPKQRSEPGKFVHRVYRLVPLTELEQDAYGPGGPCSGRTMPEYREELISERFFEGIG